MISLEFAVMVTPMTTPWTHIAALVRARLIEMRAFGNIARIARESGVSDATWRKLLAGEAVKSPKTQIEICDYLGWPTDTFDQLLLDPEHVPRVEAPPPALSERVSRLEVQMSEVLAIVRRIPKGEGSR